MSTTPNKGYDLQTTGSNSGTWGTDLNSSLTMIDLNLGGLLVKAVGGSSNVTINSTEAENVYHKLTGVLTGNIKYIVPNKGSLYLINNATTGSFTLTVVSDAAGTGIVVTQGTTVLVMVDSANTAVLSGITSFASALAITAGGTGAVTAAGARTAFGLGALAVLNQVTTATVNSGAATTGQYLTADGAAGTSWTSPAAALSFTGFMFDYAGSAAPTGFLLCDGTAVDRTTYAALFNIIGTSWGIGDGSTTFNLPDFRRRVSIGSGGPASVTISNTTGSIGGEETHTLLTSEMPAHTHTVQEDGTVSTGSSSRRGLFSGTAASYTTSSTGGGAAHNIMQPSAVVTKIIKT